MVLAYMMTIMKKGLNDCMAHLKKCRPEICPNEGFYKHLLAYEKKLGLISTIPKP